MPSPLSRFEPDASSRSRLVLPILLFIASLVANVGTPTKHSLITSALAWLAVCALCTFKTGTKNLLDVTPAKKNTWAAGLLFALAQVCDKAVDGRAIWWAKVRILWRLGLGTLWLRNYVGFTPSRYIRCRRVPLAVERIRFERSSQCARQTKRSLSNGLQEVAGYVDGHSTGCSFRVLWLEHGYRSRTIVRAC